MELEDMRHKIIPMHRDALRRMLGVNEVPEPVLVRYFTLKQYLDKVSAGISTMDLLRMAEDVGFNLVTGRFDEPAVRVNKIAENVEIDNIDQAAATGGTVAEVINNEIDKVEKDQSDLELGKVPLTDAEHAANDAEKFGDPNAKTAVDIEPPEVVEKSDILEDGTQVEIYVAGDPTTGIIKSHSINEHTKEVTYKVDVDGEEVDVSEDDIE